MDTQFFETGRLGENQESNPTEFVVLLDAAKTFIRVLAHFRDNVILGGAAPTVVIQAGLGQPTPIEEGAGVVSIPGSGGATVAAATCQRTAEDLDTYLVTISHSGASGPWKCHIRNNEPEALEFYGFISHVADETLVPVMKFGSDLRFHTRNPGKQSIIVRNVGTTPLIVSDAPGSRLGPEGSPASIFETPHPIAPHRSDTIVVTCDPLPEVFQRRIETKQHTFTTNDPIRAHGTLTFVIDPPVRSQEKEPKPEEGQLFCRMGDGCMEFLRGPDPSRCDRCGHSFLVHVEVPPHHGDRER